MNKYNYNRAGFEVSRGGYRRSLYSAAPSCGCTGENISLRTHEHNKESVENHCGEKTSYNGCGTNMESRYGLTCRPVGSVYAPLQDFDCLYDLERALCRGTLFSSLDLPLEVSSKGGNRRG